MSRSQAAKLPLGNAKGGSGSDSEGGADEEGESEEEFLCALNPNRLQDPRICGEIQERCTLQMTVLYEQPFAIAIPESGTAHLVDVVIPGLYPALHEGRGGLWGGVSFESRMAMRLCVFVGADLTMWVVTVGVRRCTWSILQAVSA